ncbi:DUF5680 domain-containing protein [Marispirochaeta sp.]|uniref:DUF5680 domain-containing protein n=1 Tax=Marispirochaeta sp. TaxID=2038653 RepID=UPI0029C9820E|nr:DUF5680 domain-containing protein [Marispirochaeta sp.]
METIIPFLIKAKENCYAAGMIPVSSTRKNSKDLHYSEGDLRYLDSFFGAERFLGQEVVWKKNREVWGMNYYGCLLEDAIPEDFPDFLRKALSRIDKQNPYRGMSGYKEGDFIYQCSWTGAFEQFRGEEYVTFGGSRIYEMYFHGGIL